MNAVDHWCQTEMEYWSESTYVYTSLLERGVDFPEGQQICIMSVLAGIHDAWSC